MALEDTLHYVFSTIPQVLAAVIAVIGAFLLFGISATQQEWKHAEGDQRERLADRRFRYIRAISVVLWTNVLVIFGSMVALTQVQNLAVRPTEAYIAMALGVVAMCACFGVNTWALFRLVNTRS